MGMSAEFDPYYRWLSIPPAQQPPDHYRLLGVDRFESDAAVIENAADRQMAHVRNFQHGPHGRLSQLLLNEISAAKLCLLNPISCAEYDASLSVPAPSKKSRSQAAQPADRHHTVDDPPSASKLKFTRASAHRLVRRARRDASRRRYSRRATLGGRWRRKSSLTAEVLKIIFGGLAGVGISLLLIMWIAQSRSAAHSPAATQAGQHSQPSSAIHHSK